MIERAGIARRCPECGRTIATTRDPMSVAKAADRFLALHGDHPYEHLTAARRGLGHFFSRVFVPAGADRFYYGEPCTIAGLSGRPNSELQGRPGVGRVKLAELVRVLNAGPWLGPYDDQTA